MQATRSRKKLPGSGIVSLISGMASYLHEPTANMRTKLCAVGPTVYSAYSIVLAKGRVQPEYLCCRLHCLLRIKKPLVISFDPQKGKLTPAEYKRITGHDWDGDSDFLPSGRKALDRLMDDFGWGDHRANWTNAYQVLRSKGYDGLFYPDVAADHSDGHYGKYVVFDPKNVRLVDAAFDPSKSDSADLRA